MLSIYLDTLDKTRALSRLCENYRSSFNFNTDVIKGRYVVDGCSQLALVSLIGNFVTIDPLTNDDIVLNKFERDLIAIGGHSDFAKKE